jgi:hypothetical protein
MLKQPDVRAGDRLIGERVLTIAHLRKNNWQECIAESEKSVPVEGFAAAIAHFRLGERQQAHARYNESASQMDDEFEDLLDFPFGTEQLRAEAEELMGISKEPNKPEPHMTEAEN